MPLRTSSSLVALMLLAAACGGGSPPAVAQREAAEPVRDAAPARPWFGPNDGLDNIIDGFGAAIDEVRAPPHFELLEHYPKMKPDILLERFGVTTTTDLADGSATQSVSQCVRSFYAGKTGADFTALIDGASGRGWKKEALGDVVVFLDEAGDRPLTLAPASEGDPTLPKELGPALLVEQCRRYKPESGAANIKGRLSFDWRLKPIKELATLLERLPDELYWGRVGDRAVGAGTLRIGRADEAAVTKWISDHGFVARPEQKKNEKKYALGDDALTVELTVAGSGDSHLLVVKTTTPWPAK
jgi:hypothetical protein